MDLSEVKQNAQSVSGRPSYSLRKLPLRHICLFWGVADNDRLQPHLMPTPILNRPQQVNHLLTFGGWQPQQKPYQIGDGNLFE